MKKRLKKKKAMQYINSIQEEIMLAILCKEDKCKVAMLQQHHSMLLKNYKSKNYYY